MCSVSIAHQKFAVIAFICSVASYDKLNKKSCIPVMIVSRVFDLAERAIRLQQRVLSLHDVTVARLVLGLVVTSVGVRYGVRVVVFRVSLE